VDREERKKESNVSLDFFFRYIFVFLEQEPIFFFDFWNLIFRRQKIPAKNKTLCPIWKKKNMLMFSVSRETPLAQLQLKPLTVEVYDYEAVGV
jgi:hypothetical protein